MTGKKINFLGSSFYLKDINKYRVMTPDREKEIAKMILSGNLSDDDMISLKKEMIEGNLKFVLSICKQYQNLGIDIEDLISEGNYGLLKAFEHFDWKKNIRFISYGKFWIKQAVIQLLNENSRTIRLPVNIIQSELKNNKSDIPSNLVEKKIMHHKVDLFEFSDKIDNDDIFIYDDSEGNEDIQIRNKIAKIIDYLDEREKEIIKKYYGIDSEPFNLEEIGEQMQLTKERVRQIKEVAIRKLRNNILEISN